MTSVVIPYFLRRQWRLISPPAPDERPRTPEADCLWLLRLSPDQVRRSPLWGPLAGRRQRTNSIIITAPCSDVKEGRAVSRATVSQRAARLTFKANRRPRRKQRNTPLPSAAAHPPASPTSSLRFLGGSFPRFPRSSAACPPASRPVLDRRQLAFFALLGEKKPEEDALSG